MGGGEGEGIQQLLLKRKRFKLRRSWALGSTWSVLAGWWRERNLLLRVRQINLQMHQSRLKRHQKKIVGTLYTWLQALNIKDNDFTIYAALNWCTGRRYINYLHRILHKTLPCNGSQTCDTCSSLHRCLRSGTVMTCKESEIIIKNLDVNCLLFIDVILFRV